MIAQNLLHASESYTHKNWVHKNVFTGFSRMYYIIDGIAFYEEGGKKIKLKKKYLYFTPVKKAFDLYDDPSDQLLHTYAHITTSPPIRKKCQGDLAHAEFFIPLCLQQGVQEPLWNVTEKISTFPNGCAKIGKTQLVIFP